MLNDSDIARLMAATVEGGGDCTVEVMEEIIAWAQDVKASSTVLHMILTGQATVAMVGGEICIGGRPYADGRP